MSSPHPGADPRWADPRTVALLPGQRHEAPDVPAEPWTAAPPEPAGRSWRTPAALVAAGAVLGAFLQAPIRDAFTSSPAAVATSPATAQPVPPATLPSTQPSAPAATQAPAPNSTGLDTTKIAAAVDPGIVDITIRTAQGAGAGAGTGMLLTSTGRVLTNDHVIDGATSIVVTVTASGRTYRADVVGADRTDDVAVLQLVNASGLTPVPLGASAPVAVGDQVAALGNAGGRGGTPTLTTGTVLALNQSITASDAITGASNRLTGLIEINAALEPGDSGGPLVNAQAKVVGMNTAASASRQFDTASSSDGYAIPLSRALAIATQMVAGHASSTIHLGLPGRLGVRLANGTNAHGVPIAAVQASLPAAGAGLVAGDVITSLGGIAVRTPEQLLAQLSIHRAGQATTLRWISPNGTTHVATIRLAAGAAD